ncbi:MAG: EAL domain-containing protein, partial [Lachnospiraceae bacterium]|nr:EAL domain-containing protein [Lachnospiraceae bacterium]
MDTLGLQYAEIAITLILFITSMRKNRVGSHQSNLYLGIVCLAFFSACFDIGSIILIRNQEMVSSFLLYLVCRGYIISLMWIATIGFLYLIAASDYKEFPKIMWGTVCISIVGTIIIAFTPLYLSVEPVYSYGPAANATYGFTLLFIILMVVALINNHRRFSKRRIFFTFLWIALWVGAALIQFFHPDILLVGFASGIGLLIMYFELENPDSYIDRDTGLYNQYSLSTIESQWRREEIRFNRTDIFLQTDKWNVSAKQADEMVVKIAHILKKAECRKVFHRANRVFTIIDHHEEHIYHTIDLVKRYVAEMQKKNPGIRMQVIMLENSLLVDSGADMDMLFKFYESNLMEEIFRIDEAAIAVMRNEDETIEEIKSALREDRVEVFYQPIWSVKEEKFKSAEALVRIRAVDGSIIPPGKFIPVAEKSGLI